MSQAKRRGKLLVDRQVQGTIVKQLVTHWIIAFFVTLFYLFILNVFATGSAEPLAAHVRRLWEQYGSLFVVLITLFPVFLYDSIRVSHRFAGPMVSFRKSLKSLAHGDAIGRMTFRDGDFWSDLASSLNQVASRLGQLKADSGSNPPSTN